ncbi:MAG: hypothetical protein Kow00121_17260 [Elainellaceae cyanobacterium]
METDRLITNQTNQLITNQTNQLITNRLTKELYAAISDLHHVSPIVGFLRFGSLAAALLSLVALAWLTPLPWVFITATCLAGVVYGFLLICTHDMLHHTLTGWLWFERLFARLVSYPMLWPYGLYAELHRLHHGWNGIDLRDPERVQWTWNEYQQAQPIVQWYVRHQWAIDIFVLGGFGLIFKTFFHALRLQKIVPRIRTQLWIDLTGIVTIQGLFLSFAVLQGQGLRYLLFWFLLERVIGVIGQTRDHLEHYGLWGKTSQFQLTQLYTCRNLCTSPIMDWLMGGLPYHAVHHAFPDIPFNQLPEAFTRIQNVLEAHRLPPMQLDEGYIKTAFMLSQSPCMIGELTSTTAGRNAMVPIKS